MTSEPQFHKVPGTLDTFEAADDAGAWWQVVRRGNRWHVTAPNGADVGAGESSKLRAFDACRISMRGGHVEPPAMARATTPKPVSAEERAHRDRIRALGCIIGDTHCGGPTEYAHCKPRQDGHGIPLCAKHHRTGGYGIAWHAGEQGFIERYGTEAELLELTNEKLADLDALTARILAGEVIA